MSEAKAVFLFNLLQDVNVLRGLVLLVARETDAVPVFLVSEGFAKRDLQKVWQAELGVLAGEVGAEIFRYGGEADAFAVLQDGHGIVVAGSESTLPAHRATGDVFRVAPPGWMRITVQHGLECVGFLQGREHVIAHGRNVGFNADIVCGWFAAEALSAMPWNQRSKLQVTGPPTLLQRATSTLPEDQRGTGLICENLHSVRLRMTGDHQTPFMDTFFEFCQRLSERDEAVTLRPHPGGQYMLKSGVALPDNVRVSRDPIYRIDLSGFAYGVSAPSTVVFDMVLAGIPTAVWRDPSGRLDVSNYAGLTEISTLDDWLDFARAAREDRDAIIGRQRAFLDGLAMPLDPQRIYARFARILRNALDAMSRRAASTTMARPSQAKLAAPGRGRATPLRLLLVANSVDATLEISFLKPLAADIAAGAIVVDLLTERQITDAFGAKRLANEAADWFRGRIESFAPDIIVASRYGGPHPRILLHHAASRRVPLVYHIDDDLLNIPPEIGESKFRHHNDPKRLRTVDMLLSGAALVYCSTPALLRRFRSLGYTGPMIAGEVYCTSSVLRRPICREVRKIGYTGFSSHSADLAQIETQLEAYLSANPAVSMELFGTVAVPERLERFGGRIVQVPPERSYEAFRRVLVERDWDIGICPLAYTPFNAVKANTKWVEYTASGIATVAPAGMVYDSCAGRGRGLLVAPDEWVSALQVLTDAPDLRHAMVQAAQVHLLSRYSDAALRAQVMAVLERATDLGSGADTRPLAELRQRVVVNENGEIEAIAAS